MTLYSADIMDLAKPVEKLVEKKRRKKTAIPTPEPSEVSEVPESVEAAVNVKKPKKEMSEKQKAALEKAQESRKRKKEEALALKNQQDQEAESKRIAEEEKQQALLAKKEAAKEKRRLAKEKRKGDEIDQAVDNLVKIPKPKKAKVVRGEDPPSWFQKYIEGVKREQSQNHSDKKPVKQIQLEATEMAAEKWKDGLVRDRVQNELDSHASRMYSMIFNRR